MGCSHLQLATLLPSAVVIVFSETKDCKNSSESRIPSSIARRTWRSVLPGKIGTTKKKEQPGPPLSQIVLETVQSD